MPKVALRPVGALFSETAQRFGMRWNVLLEIVLLPVLLCVFGTVLISLGMPFEIIGGLVYFVGWVALIYSTLPVIYSIHTGSGVDASYKATLAWFWPFVWMGIIEVCAVMGGFAMLIIPGIFLSVAVSFMCYVFVVEGRRGIDALRQSKEYVKGYWWAVFGRTILIGLIFAGLSIVVRAPLMLVAGATAGAVAALVLSLFFVPFAAVYSYLIFMNLREIKPELGAAQTKEGTGFIKASAIVGVVFGVIMLMIVPILIGIFLFKYHGTIPLHAGTLPGYRVVIPQRP